MKTFIPFPDKIEVKPFKPEKAILSQNESLVEAGEVISVGSEVKFVKVGDTIYFDAWGCSKTPKIDGVEHYVVQENTAVILGKNGK